MGLEVQQFSVVAVEKPQVGETIPSEVRAEICIDVTGLKPQVLREWDSLRQYDVLFLVAIIAPLQPYTGRIQDLETLEAFPEKFGIVGLRGCEVLEVLDEDGVVISDTNPFEPRVPMGTARTIRVLLDPNQYAQDISRMEEEGFEDFYGYFNLVIRRHAKQNNFKAVLSTIRTLMNRPEDAIVPTWLHDLFLGYGDPASSQFFRLPSRLYRLDLRDTFIDLQHLMEAFPPVSSSSSPSKAFVKKVLLDEHLESLMKKTKKKKKRQETERVLCVEDGKRDNSPPHGDNTEEDERERRKGESKEDREEEKEEDEKEEMSSSFRVPIVVELQDADAGDENDSAVQTAGGEGKEKGEKEKNKKDEKVSVSSSSSSWPSQIIRASSYTLPSMGPYIECERNVNQIRFTPQQVRALISGLEPGLTLVVGPPGSGKTDTASQLAYLLYHNFPDEKIVLVAHSNAALNDLFRKIRNLDVDDTHLLRLGRGEQDLSSSSSPGVKKPSLSTSSSLQAQGEKSRRRVGEREGEGGEEEDEEEEDFSFSKHGRVNRVLEKRKELLKKVERLGRALEKDEGYTIQVGDISFSCETALQFQRYHIIFRIERYRVMCRALEKLFKVREERRRERHRENGETKEGGEEEEGKMKEREEEKEKDDEEEEVFWKKVEKVFRDLAVQRGRPVMVRIKREDLYKTKEGAERTEIRRERTIDGTKKKKKDSKGNEEEEEEEEESEDEDVVMNEEEVDEEGFVLLDPVRAMRDYDRTYVEALFPFPTFFQDSPVPLFCGDLEKDREMAESCFRYVDKIFSDIENCRAFELLRTAGDRANYLITKHARIIAMTCTHAAITRHNLVDAKFEYDSLIIEEAGQILEVETFIPMLLQQLERSGISRLKRVVLFGDHHQLPPIVKHL
ncbi:protein emb- isoform related, partial [Cystoisospora suis]